LGEEIQERRKDLRTYLKRELDAQKYATYVQEAENAVNIYSSTNG
jgi:hypothetical protein